ncbi:hypothetical protein [Fodinicola acaciae]|uniref:hypothetical protein n=1 Tax=Fodinicola acaciae TaxID=2681555 RepID=UPI0013D52024|nr:hypothetical protein [Fodinicola acaciae]
MVLRRLLNRLRVRSYGPLAGAQEAVVFVVLSNEQSKTRCSPAYVEELSRRVMKPAIAELDSYFDGRWASDVEPWLVLEGPSLTYKFTVVKLPGRELGQMSERINAVFNKHWRRELDRAAPH